MPSIEFKTPKVEAEYGELLTKNRALYDLIESASVFAGYEFGKPLVITGIYRTQAMQDDRYAHIPADRRRKSPHQFWHAVDLRSWIYTDTEISRFVQFFNTFTTAGGQRKVALYHEIPGNVKHFHVQYWR